MSSDEIGNSALQLSRPAEDLLVGCAAMVSIGLNLFSLCLLRWEDVLRARRVPVLLLVTIVSSVMSIAVLLVQRSGQCRGDATCPMAAGVAFFLADLVGTLSLGGAAVLRTAAIADLSHARYVRHFAWAFVLYPIVTVVGLLSVFNRDLLSAGQIVYLVGNTMILANGMAIEFYVIYVFHCGGLNNKWLAPYRKQRNSAIAVHVVNMVTMAGAGILAFFDRHIGIPLLILVTSCQILDFCVFNFIVHKAYTKSCTHPTSGFFQKSPITIPATIPMKTLTIA